MELTSVRDPYRPTQPMSPLLDEVLSVHGGLELWRRCRRIDAHLSSGGLAFASKLQGKALLDRSVTVLPHTRTVKLAPYPAAGYSGEWQADCVRIVCDDGTVAQERRSPRASFARVSRRFRWDSLDMLYFAGYALWNYLSFPFLLAGPGVDIQDACKPGDGQRRMLLANFPADFPTHSRRQVFHISPDGSLLRHDYVAQVLGAYAAGANICLASQTIRSLRFYSSRRVYPRIGADVVMPWPTLVWIELANFAVVFDADRPDSPCSGRSAHQE